MDTLSVSDLLSSIWGITLVAIFFGGSIFVHELGHFLAARRRGLKVERFSIGFGPKILGWTDKDGVDYRISLIPLGGYVALPQLAEMEGIEGASAEGAEALPRISYADKMIVSVMGAVFNVIFAFVLACILWFTGTPVAEGSRTTEVGYVPETVVTGAGHLAELGLGRTEPGPAFAAGIKPGDVILEVDGQKVGSFNQVQEAIMLGNRKDAAGQPVATLTLAPGPTDSVPRQVEVRPARAELNRRSGDAVRIIGVQPAARVVVGDPAPGSPAAKAGLRRGDRVLSVDGKRVGNFAEFRELLRKGGASARRMEIERAAGESVEKLTVEVTPLSAPTVNPVGLLEYRDGDVTRTIVLVPSTRDIVTPAGESPRDRLMVLGVSPESPALSETLRIGTAIDKVDAGELSAVRSLGDMEKAAGATTRDMTVFWTRADGETGHLVLRDARFRRPAPVEHAQIGAPFLSRTELAHLAPWETCANIIASTLRTLQRLFDRDSDIEVKQLASVISISKTYYNLSEDIRRVIWFTVLINLNLAVLNLLPIPVLDGGHMLIATIQRLTGDAIGGKVIVFLQYAFMALLLGFMGYVMLHDVRRCSGDSEQQLKQQLLERHVYRPAEFATRK
ncbi:MAG: site-2 protease family protein [Opitutia bacterium]